MHIFGFSLGRDRSCQLSTKKSLGELGKATVIGAMPRTLPSTATMTMTMTLREVRPTIGNRPLFGSGSSPVFPPILRSSLTRGRLDLPRPVLHVSTLSNPLTFNCCCCDCLSVPAVAVGGAPCGGWACCCCCIYACCCHCCITLSKRVASMASCDCQSNKLRYHVKRFFS